MMEIIRMVVVLSAITGLSGFVLSGLKVWTTPIIEEQVLMNVQGPALKQLFVNSNNDPIADRKKLPKPGSEGEEIVVFPAIKDGKLLAVAMEARNYRTDRPRTHYRELQFSAADYNSFVIMAILGAGSLLVGRWLPGPVGS